MTTMYRVVAERELHDIVKLKTYTDKLDIMHGTKGSAQATLTELVNDGYDCVLSSLVISKAGLKDRYAMLWNRQPQGLGESTVIKKTPGTKVGKRNALAQKQQQVTAPGGPSKTLPKVAGDSAGQKVPIQKPEA